MNSRISSRIFLFIVADALNIKKHTSTILLINTKFCNYTLNFRNNNSFNRTIIELRPSVSTSLSDNVTFNRTIIELRQLSSCCICASVIF